MSHQNKITLRQYILGHNSRKQVQNKNRFRQIRLSKGLDVSGPKQNTLKSVSQAKFQNKFNNQIKQILLMMRQATDDKHYILINRKIQEMKQHVMSNLKKNQNQKMQNMLLLSKRQFYGSTSIIKEKSIQEEPPKPIQEQTNFFMELIKMYANNPQQTPNQKKDQKQQKKQNIKQSKYTQKLKKSIYIEQK